MAKSEFEPSGYEAEASKASMSLLMWLLIMNFSVSQLIIFMTLWRHVALPHHAPWICWWLCHTL